METETYPSMKATPTKDGYRVHPTMAPELSKIVHLNNACALLAFNGCAVYMWSAK